MRTVDLRVWLATMLLVAGCSATGPDRTDEQAPDDVPAIGVPMQVLVDSLPVRTAPGEANPALTYTVVDAGVAAAVEVNVSREAFVLTFQEEGSEGRRWIRLATSIDNHFFEPIKIGWVPLEVDGRPTLGPADRRLCPPGPGEGSRTAPHDVSALACFGSRPWTITGQITQPAACAALRWQDCGWHEVPSLGPVPLFVDRPMRESVQFGVELEVRGRFDHPGAGECGSAEDDPDARMAAVVTCRTSFVVESINLAGPIPDAHLVPELRFVAAEPYADGAWIRYRFETVNAGAFADEVFMTAPKLPGCGAWEPAARAWIRLFDERGRELALICRPGSSASLQDLAFVIPSDAAVPAAVVLEIHDRATDSFYRSEPVLLGP